jgi:hypothetical protein
MDSVSEDPHSILDYCSKYPESQIMILDCFNNALEPKTIILDHCKNIQSPTVWR